MKKEDVEVGATYGAKVGNRTIDVRIESANAKGGWNATAVDTGKPARIKGAGQLVGPAGAAGSGEDAGADEAPLPSPDKGKKRSGKKAKAPKEKRAKVPAKEMAAKPLSCLDAAAAVLKSKGEPMRCADMIAAMKEKGLWETNAPTPAATLYSALLREITKKGDASRFRKADRGLFALKE